MTTYAETQDTSSLPWMAPPDRYSLFLAPAPGAGFGCVEVAPDSDNPDAFEVMDIPASIPPHRVALHVARIAIWRHPDQLYWSAVADLPAGALLLVSRAPQMDRDAEHVGAHVPDATHWTGERCVGFFRVRA